MIANANPSIDKLVVGVTDQYIIDAQLLRTSRADGPNLDQQLCVLWRFADGKIVGGQHLKATRMRSIASSGRCCRHRHNADRKRMSMVVVDKVV